MKADELIDRIAEKVARMKTVDGVQSDDRRMLVHLKDGSTVTFRVVSAGGTDDR